MTWPGGSACGGAMTERIDLNADLGESFGRWQLGDDTGLLPSLTSANVACGFHAGDPATLVRTCSMAVAQGVRIGAQVAYRDLAGFGRRFIDASYEELFADVLYQIGALDGIARSQGGRVAYVKPHGALYNTAVHHETHARAVVDAAIAAGGLPVMGLPGSRLLVFAAAAGLPCYAEAFVDRAYTADGTLVPRSVEGSVITDPLEACDRATSMVVDHRVRAITGELIPIMADSLCLHGDTPDAVGLARAVRDALQAAGVQVTAR